MMRPLIVAAFALATCLAWTLEASAQGAVQVRWLRGDNRAIDLATESAPLSHRVTNDATLTRETRFADTSDVEDLRVELLGLSTATVVDAMVAESVDGAGLVRDRQALTWVRGTNDSARSSFLRLVGDEIDRTADGVEDRTLRVALGDRVRVIVGINGTSHSSDLPIGSSGGTANPTQPQQATVRAVIVRTAPRGPAVIGKDDAAAVDILRKQIDGANRVWLQCFISFGEPALSEVVIVDPPTPTLLAIADEDGLPALGGGDLRLQANGVTIDAGPTRAGATPVETAVQIAGALRKAGFRTRITENPLTEMGAGRSADVLVRDAHDQPVTLTAPEGRPVSTDRRQIISIGSVDLGDGLSEFNNMTAAAGSLEERTLIKTLADNDPATIDIFVVNRFAFGTRQGEAFIESSGGPIANVLVLDRVGLRQQHTAFTLPHEIGHVLLNQPYHPDNVGPDAPWLLMDSDSNAGTVSGPKRLTWDECHRARAQSAQSLPHILRAPPQAPSPSPIVPRTR